MDSFAVTEDGLEWSESSFTVEEIVKLYELPCLVRVSEGIYSSYDTESFSTGDFLKLHSWQHIEKVVAYPVGSTTPENNLRDYKSRNTPLLIPLDYCTKARVVTQHGNRAIRYPTVGMMLKDFPKHVQVGAKPISGRGLLGRSSVTVPARSPLELIRKTTDMSTKSVSLICLFKNQEIEFSPDCAGDFIAVADTRTYTLREIANKFSFPCIIELPEILGHGGKFVTSEASSALSNMARFNGRFVLDHLQKESKVLGSHRLDLNALMDPQIQAEYKNHRAIVLVPLSSDAEFQVAENRQNSDYQSVITLRYPSLPDSTTTANMYIEVHGSNKSQTMETDDYSYPDLRHLTVPDFSHAPEVDPSPSALALPPRRDIAPQAGRLVDSPPDVTSPTNPPARPPKPKPRTYNRPMPPAPQEDPATKRPTHQATPLVKRVPPMVKPKPIRDSDYLVPVECKPDLVSGTSEVKITIPERIKPSLAVAPQVVGERVERKHNYMTGPAESKKEAELRSQTSQKSRNSDSDYEFIPEPQWNINKAWADDLKAYTVEMVKEALEKIGFGGKKVEAFVGERIDGDYLLEMVAQPEFFDQKPFCLDQIEKMKLRKFVESGKLPNRGQR